jgi:hypothetical protein
MPLNRISNLNFREYLSPYFMILQPLLAYDHLFVDTNKSTAVRAKQYHIFTVASQMLLQIKVINNRDNTFHIFLNVVDL